MRIRSSLERERLSRAEKERLVLLNNMQELVCIFQLEGNFLYTNPMFVKRLGYEEKDLKDLTFPMALEIHEIPKWRKMKHRLSQGADYQDVAFMFKTQKGETVYTVGSLNPVLSQGNQKIMGIFRDMTSYLELEKERDRLFLFAIDLLCVMEFNGRFKRVNPVFEHTLGYPAYELLRKSFMELVHPDDWVRTKKECTKILQGCRVPIFESRFRCKNGSYKWLSWTAHLVLSERVIYAVARDVTQEREAREKLQEMAFTDDLTDILNRRGFNLFAKKLWQIAAREKKTFLLLLADLDGLKEINDRYGHAEGDAALRRIAGILKGRFRSSDVVARLGGDEFVAALIVQESLDPIQIKEELEKYIQENTSRDYFDFSLSLSIGFSSDSGGRLPLEDMIREADRMMYQEKSLKARSRFH